jgi:hypothetical protein
MDHVGAALEQKLGHRGDDPGTVRTTDQEPPDISITVVGRDRFRHII